MPRWSNFVNSSHKVTKKREKRERKACFSFLFRVPVSQSQTVQTHKDTIVQVETAQLSRLLCLTTFSNHIDIGND